MTRKITKKSAKKIAVVLAAATAFSASPVLPASLTIQANAAITEAGGALLTIPATGPESAAQLPFHNALKDANGFFTDYYQVVYSGYFDISMSYDDVTDRDLRMYIPENSR